MVCYDFADINSKYPVLNLETGTSDFLPWSSLSDQLCGYLWSLVQLLMLLFFRSQHFLFLIRLLFGVNTSIQIFHWFQSPELVAAVWGGKYIIQKHQKHSSGRLRSRVRFKKLSSAWRVKATAGGTMVGRIDQACHPKLHLFMVVYWVNKCKF